MKKLQSCLMFSILICTSVNLFSQDTTETDDPVGYIVKSYCSVNAELYNQCFNLDEAQCRQVYRGVIETCRQNPDGYPVNYDDPQAKAEFEECTTSAFLSYLESTGIDLEATCEQ